MKANITSRKFRIPQNPPFRTAALAGLALALFATAGLAQTLIYEQDFTNTSGLNQPVSLAGWNAYAGTTANDVSSTSIATQGSVWIGLTSSTGNPNTSTGFLAFVNSTTATSTFTAVTTGLSLDNPSTISWRMNSTASTALNAQIRLLVQVAGNWYASAAISPTALAENGTQFASDNPANITTSLTFSTTAASWSSFTLAPGSSAAVGSVLSSDLTSSTITGIGFYETGITTLRLDTLQVYSIPEPGSAAYLGAGAALLALLLRRKAIGGRTAPRCL